MILSPPWRGMGQPGPGPAHRSLVEKDLVFAQRGFQGAGRTVKQLAAVDQDAVSKAISRTIWG